MEKLATLYKRTRTGAIQFWEVGTIRDTIFKTSGQLGTANPIRHAEICYGKNIGKKNETTPEQQAESQSLSDWKGKRDEGYKSFEDLGISRIKDGPQNGLLTAPGLSVPPAKSLFEVLDATLPQFNTDANGEVKPMLAPTKPFVAGKQKYPQLLEKKLDGCRTLCQVTKDSTGVVYSIVVKFLSRSGKPYSHLTHLEHIIASAAKYFPDGTTILDGELYYHGWTLEEINEAVKKLRPETAQLQFWVYDLPLNDGNQVVRSSATGIIVRFINSPFVVHAQPTTVNSDAEVIKHHDDFVEQGYEGAMLKKMDGTYAPGQRSPSWQKVKMFDDNEFEIVDFRLGQRGTEDLIAICKCEAGTFDPKMMGTRESKQAIYDRREQLIGKKLTVKHFGYSKYNIPNLPTGKCIRDND